MHDGSRKGPRVGRAGWSLALAGLREAAKLFSGNLQPGIPPTAAEELARGSQGGIGYLKQSPQRRKTKSNPEENLPLPGNGRESKGTSPSASCSFPGRSDGEGEPPARLVSSSACRRMTRLRFEEQETRREPAHPKGTWFIHGELSSRALKGRC